jgi:hypothetical protein
MSDENNPGGQGNAEPAGAQVKWFDSLSDDTKNNQLITQHNDVQGLVSDYISVKGKVPVIPKQYTFNDVEGMEINQTERDAFTSLAKENGMTQAQVDSLIKFDIERQTTALDTDNAEYEALRQEAEETLKAEWGAEYDTKLNDANRAYMQFADDEFKEFNEQTGYANNPVVIRYFSRMAEKFKEADFKMGDGGGFAPKHYDDGTPMLHYPSMQSD